MLTPDTVGLSPEDQQAYADSRRFLAYQHKVLRELRPVWPIPPHVLAEAYRQMLSAPPMHTESAADSVWHQRDLVALVAGLWDEFPDYVRAVPMKALNPTFLLKRKPEDNPAIQAYFKLLSLMPDFAVLVFPVLHHGNWVAHNLGEPPFPQPLVRAMLPAVAADKRSIQIMPVNIFNKEFRCGKEED